MSDSGVCTEKIKNLWQYLHANPTLFSAIAGILFVSVAGSLLHFTYDWSGQNLLVGLFSAVNESTWEHMKLAFFPMLLYIFLSPILFARCASPHAEAESTCSSAQPDGTDSSCTSAQPGNPDSSRSSGCPDAADATAVLVGTWLIPVLFYTYGGILGFHVPALDIATFFISVIAAFALRYHMQHVTLISSQKEDTQRKKSTSILFTIIAVLFVCFLLFTIYPPDLGIFISPV